MKKDKTNKAQPNLKPFHCSIDPNATDEERKEIIEFVEKLKKN